MNVFTASARAAARNATPLRKAAAVVAGGGVYATAVWMAYQHVRDSSNSTTTEEQQEGSSSAVGAPCGGGGGCCGCGAGPSAVAPSKPAAAAPSQGILTSPDRTLQFDRIASCYDDRIQWDETFMGIQLLRRLLLRHASGDVLEVGAGTARNLSYYRPDQVRRLVLADSSPAMLERARSKIRSITAGAATAALSRGELRPAMPKMAACQADAQRLPLPDLAFDTVVDTFGLCSYDDPVAALREMSRVCKPGGKILLLEHGRSKSWEWLSRHLDRTAPCHAARWGCVWNRDLDDILERSGLRVDSIHTWHFGTTYYVLCRPALSSAISSGAAASSSSPGSPPAGEQQTT
jgi:methyltransferase OMS1